MRVTTGLSFDRSVRYMQESNSRLETLNRQYNTGAKFVKASENPTGMGTRLRLDSEIASYQQYSVNAGLASDQLSLEETALSSIYESMLHAVTSMQAGVNGTYDQANFNTVAQDLEEVRDMLFNLMNTKTAGGEYIFPVEPSDANEADYTLPYVGDLHANIVSNNYEIFVWWMYFT